MIAIRFRILAIAIAGALASASALALAQKSTPAQVAEKLSGTWKINRELSPSIGRGRGGVAAAAVPTLVRASFQRRGGGGNVNDASSAQDLTPEQIAARNAVRQLQQLPETLKIVATTDQVTFTEPRGVSSFPANNKSVKIDLGDTKVDVKTRWDKETLRQEFSAYQQKLTRTWSVDENGRLMLNLLVESMVVNNNGGTPTWTQQTAVAVFDRQQ
jgi:hypothetical protein